MKYVSIIDMGINNTRSVVGILNYCDFRTKITKNEDEIMNSSALILPGVGSFPEGMKNLKKNNLDIIIKNFYKKNKPILAICLGFQMLFTSSDEFKLTKGLNFINGKVKSLEGLNVNKISPNLGWNAVNIKRGKNNLLFKKLNPNSTLYFIHSYFVQIEDKKCSTSYINFGGKQITSSIQKKNLFGVQFHPEKSGKNGIKIIKNFLNQVNS